jgi:hypothetical protein
MRATNLTDKTINTFETIQVKGLDLTKFYCITLHIEKIVIMGKFSSELLRECKKIFGQEKVIKPFELTENDWVMGEYEIGEIAGLEGEGGVQGIRIDITLT